MKHIHNAYADTRGKPQIIRRVSETAAEYAACISRDPAGTGHSVAYILSAIGLLVFVALGVLGALQ